MDTNETIIYQLNDTVHVTVRGQNLGRGQIIGRSYTDPMSYDVRFFDGGIISDIGPGQLANE